MEQSIASVAVAVAKDGKIIWEEGFGWADREKRIPATAHTMYSLASISKPITTTGLMALVQTGKVNLDAPANDYLGNAKLHTHTGDVREATVRRLANHTSGLPLYFQFYYADEPYRPPSMDETILRYAVLAARPGERVQYSNMGLGVLGYIIERVSGMSYAQYMRREVFLPLGLTRTSVAIGPGLEAYAATRYGSDGLPLPLYESDTPGAGAVYASAHDLVRFGMFHLKAHLPDQKAILSDASIDEMHRRTSSKSAADLSGFDGFGIGFAVGEDEGRYRQVGHNGGMAGAATDLRLLPEHKLAVVVLSNSFSLLPYSLPDRIIAGILPGRKAPQQKESAVAPPFVAPAELLGTWKGSIATYVKDIPVELRFLPSGEVHAKLGEQSTALVDQPRLEDGVFSGKLSARIETPDTQRYAYYVWLNLALRGDVLNGGASAHTDRRGPRLRNVLTHWMEVRRER